MREEIRKIVGRTLLDFQQQGENFAFKQLSTQAATAAVKKLRENGYPNAYQHKNVVIVAKVRF